MPQAPQESKDCPGRWDLPDLWDLPDQWDLRERKVLSTCDLTLAQHTYQ